MSNTPKEKAEELFNKMFEVKDSFSKFDISYDIAKQCALIAVDEIIGYCHTEHIKFYIEVKEEIEKL